jgi:hypothetical protein
MQTEYTKEIPKDLPMWREEEPGAVIDIATAAQTTIVRISRTSIWRLPTAGARPQLNMAFRLCLGVTAAARHSFRIELTGLEPSLGFGVMAGAGTHGN